MADETAVTEAVASSAAIAPEVGSKATLAADPPAYDRAGLESTVAAGLASVFSDDTSDPELEIEAAESEGLAPAKTDDEKEGTDTPEAAAAVEPVVKTDASVTAPTLPAAYVRSLKAYDWTQEEIDRAAKDPQFVATAALIHRNRNKEVSQWADAGRKAREGQQTQDEKREVIQTTSTPAQLSPVDTASLKKKYGEDALIDALAGPVNEAIKQINAILPVVQQVQGRAQQSELETLGRQIETFFGSEDVKPFKDMYGNDPAALTPVQIENRNKVLAQADALIVGAGMQGRRLTFDEAMTHALDSLTGDAKQQVARTTIRKELRTRERGITLRPSTRGATANSGPVRSRADLEQKTRQGLAAVFGT